jgi:hypothetical protein
MFHMIYASVASYLHRHIYKYSFGDRGEAVNVGYLQRVARSNVILWCDAIILCHSHSIIRRHNLNSVLLSGGASCFEITMRG